MSQLITLVSLIFIILSNLQIFLLPFLFLCNFHYTCVILSVVVPQFLTLGLAFVFFHSFFFSHFHFKKSLLTYLQASWFFPWHCLIKWWALQRYFHDWYGVFISSISFSFFPRISNALLHCHLFLHSYLKLLIRSF